MTAIFKGILCLSVTALLLCQQTMAAQTGTWAGTGATWQSSTDGDITIVTLSASPVSGNGSRWAIRGGETLAAPGAGYYSPDSRNQPVATLTFEPGNNNAARRITFAFSRPVTNPVMHVDRLGGQVSNRTNTAAWTLNTAASSGATSLTKVAGTDHLVVDGGSQRFRGSSGVATRSGWFGSWNGSCRDGAADGAACGSVRINGTFTELAFDVEMLGQLGSGDEMAIAFTFDEEPDNTPVAVCNADATGNMVLGGTATVDGATSQIILTEDIGDQAGAAWSQERISLALPFTMEFAVYLGTKDADGADGIAFAFHNDPGGNTVTGDFGGALGVGGLSPAVAIEFDTWDNGSGYGDIANDHTMIYNPAGYTDQTGGGSDSRYIEAFDLGNIEDGQWHDVSITWNPVSKTLEYYFDGVLVAALQRDLVAENFSGDPNVYYGFAASTGGSSNLQKACLITVPPQASADYGDAPASYGNPSHQIIDGIRLGDGISAEATGYDDPLAAADAFDDGVTLPALLPSSQDIVIEVHGAGGYLQGWIDWNGNGVFDEPAERIAADLQDDDHDGSIRIRLPDPPAGAASGDTYARFRWSTTPGLGPTEAAPDGEVEDYRVTVRETIHCPLGTSNTGGGIAPGGNGPFREAVYWLDWRCDGVGVFPANSYVYKQWQFGPVEIRGRLRDLTQSVSVYNTGDWTGDLLVELYQGVNPIGLANAVSGEAPEFAIDWEVYLDGRPIPADIIIADAEDTDDGESLVFRTDGAPWEVFAVASQTDDLLATFSAGGSELTLTSIHNYDGTGSLLALTQDVTRTEHVIQGSGHQAMAFGVFVQTDHGDIAAGYPQSGGHLLRNIASGGSKPTTPTNVHSLTLAQLSTTMPYLGEIPPSPEDADQNSPDADADGIEEDGVTFPTLIPGQSATLRIQVTEDVVGEAYVQGWIDWHRDGGFTEAEDQVALNLQDSGPLDNDATPGWISLEVSVPADAFIGDTYARFRISTTPDVSYGPMVVFDGEVEDYKVRISPQATAGRLSGRVFADTGLGATAHDGVQGGQEPGIANVLVQLLHDDDADGQCHASDTELASALTDGEGNWQLQPALADVGKAACIVAQVPASHQLVSENTGGHPLTNTDPLDGRLSLTVQPFDTDWGAILFGLVPRAMLMPDQLGSLKPGASILYAHRYTAGTEGMLSFEFVDADSSPVTPGWSAVLYRDEHCDGNVDGNEAPLAAALPVSPGETLCLLVQVFAPAEAPLGAQHQLALEARLQLANSTLLDTVSVTDITRVLIGQLQLEKRVRNLGADGEPGTADDGDSSAGFSNHAAPGDVLRYSLLFHNAGTQPLDDIQVHDATPPFTALAATIGCPSPLPEGLTGCTVQTLDGSHAPGYQGSLRWLFNGRLAPAAQGEVHYDVRVAD